jgi:hypothetical protein
MGHFSMKISPLPGSLPGGNQQFTATMQRTQCDLSLRYSNIGEPPPDVCGWLKIRGAGYDGLSGDCAWSAD